MNIKTDDFITMDMRTVNIKKGEMKNGFII